MRRHSHWWTGWSSSSCRHDVPPHSHSYHRHPLGHCPWQPYKMYLRRPPSRLFWFLVGALSAASFISSCKRHEEHHLSLTHCARPARNQSAPSTQPTSNSNGSTPPLHPTADQSSGPSQPECRTWQWRKRWEWPSYPVPPSSTPPQEQIHNKKAPDPWDRPWNWGLTPAQQESLWQIERERMQNVAKQASDAMSELSETTLDSALKAVEALSSRLAAYQEERKKQQEQLEKELDELKRNPPRLV